MIVPLDSRYATYAANRGPLAMPQAKPAGQRGHRSGPGQLRPPSADDADARRCSTPASSPWSRTSACCCARRPRPTTQNSTQLPPQLFSHSDMQDALADRLSAGAGQRRLGRAARRPDPVGQHRPAVGVHFDRQFRRVPEGHVGGRAPDRHVQRRNAQTADRAAHPRVARLGHVQRRATRRRSTRTAIVMARTNMLEDQFGDVATRSVEINDFILSALYNGPDANGNYAQKIPINTVFPAGNPLAAQLRSVAMMIAARQALGVKRQIFFVSVGGSFDNHSDQFDASGSALQPGRRRPGDPVRQARRPARPGRRRAEGVLRRHGRAGRAEQRHDVHRIRFRPHADVQRQGLRPRLGFAPPGDGRRVNGGRSTARSTTCRSAPAIRRMRGRGA